MAKKLTKKSWTVMVYMAVDNNLDENAVVDLIEMKKVGSTNVKPRGQVLHFCISP